MVALGVGPGHCPSALLDPGWLQGWAEGRRGTGLPRRAPLGNKHSMPGHTLQVQTCRGVPQGIGLPMSRVFLVKQASFVPI